MDGMGSGTLGTWGPGVWAFPGSGRRQKASAVPLGSRECLGTPSGAGWASRKAGIHLRGSGSGRTGNGAEPVAVTAGPGP